MTYENDAFVPSWCRCRRAWRDAAGDRRGILHASRRCRCTGRRSWRPRCWRSSTARPSTCRCTSTGAGSSPEPGSSARPTRASSPSGSIPIVERHRSALHRLRRHWPPGARLPPSRGIWRRCSLAQMERGREERRSRERRRRQSTMPCPSRSSATGARNASAPHDVGREPARAALRRALAGARLRPAPSTSGTGGRPPRWPTSWTRSPGMRTHTRIGWSCPPIHEHRLSQPVARSVAAVGGDSGARRGGLHRLDRGASAPGAAAPQRAARDRRGGRWQHRPNLGVAQRSQGALPELVPVQNSGPARLWPGGHPRAGPRRRATRWSS